VLYRPIVRDYCLLIYIDGTWKRITGKELQPVFININNMIKIIGNDKINGGDLYHNDDDFLTLLPIIQEAIRGFNMDRQQLADGTIMEIITENRETIKPTLDAAKII
jgi:hypothetical protein